MRPYVIVCCGVLALGTGASVVACAASGEDPPTAPSPDSGGSEVVTPEGGADEPEPDAEPGSEVDESKCSDAGWCVTSLPDEDLSMKDIWPVGDRAFAIADSATLGVKVLEWSDVGGKWEYIDDSTQNDTGLGSYAGRIWAPNEDEVYYGVAPGYIYHGKRAAPPATAWAWTRQRLQDNSRDPTDPLSGYPNYTKLGSRYAALGVWGTSGDDVYAWFTNTIYHRTSVDGGAPEWVPEYVADDPAVAAERLYFLAATGTGPDDVWFSGARARTSSGCALLVRKTSADYRRIADGVLTGNLPSSRCNARAGSLLIGGAEGWLTDIQATAADQVIGLKGARDVVKISADGDSYSVALAPVPMTVSRTALSSIWGAPEDLWLSGWGLVVRSTDDVWDGGAYRLSTVALNGAPLDRLLYQVRGTSNTNLWAIGVRNALHKTTP